MRAGLPSERSEVQNPARAEIWNEISAPNASYSSASGTTSQWIPEPVPSLKLKYGEEEMVEQKGVDTSVVKKKTRKKANDTVPEKKTGNTNTWEKAKEKALDTNGLCAQD